MAKILVIDDDRQFSEELGRQLRRIGHDVHWLDLAAEGLDLLAKEPFDLVLVDNRMPRMSGLEFLAALRGRAVVTAPVILMTSAHNDHTAIQATKMGAFCYVIKPLDNDGILPNMLPDIKHALKVGQPVPPVPIPKPDDRESQDDSVMIGRSRAMLAVFQFIGATEDESVLILGETGTGKDLVARAIHTNSPRKSHPFLAINCAALSLNLLESELFGHEKDAFTGANRMHKGYFEQASGGTLFLDEVGDMPPALQVKLLRVLQNREITRMGSCEPVEVDVRVLAATSRDLKKLLDNGMFREDLYWRLEGSTIVIPPLRDRPEDIELLAKHFLKHKSAGTSTPTLHPDALQMLRHHSWPGNIRQLKNVMHRAYQAVRLRRAFDIMPQDLSFGSPEGLSASISEPRSEGSALGGLREAIAWAWESDQPNLLPLLQKMMERELLRCAISQTGLSQTQIARKLGMNRGVLGRRLKEYGLGALGESAT